MKLKSLLFGSAAALATVTGAQAADLPTAEPVEYVRICDAFGTGFFYIPGTETCLMIGGLARADFGYTDGELVSGDDGETFVDEEDDFNNFSTEAQLNIWMDARTQTELGVLRSYIEISADVGGFLSTDDEYGDGFALEAAYIQLLMNAGTLTVGHTASFFDFAVTEANAQGIGDNDPTTEVTLFAYTFAFGNGFSATLSLEDPKSGGRRVAGALEYLDFIPDDDFGGVFDTIIASPFYNPAGLEFPDLVANIRIDQGWGSAQVMGAIGQISDSADAFDEDDDEIGWAVGAGVSVEIPNTMFTAGLVGRYAEGLVSYVTTDDIYNSDADDLSPGDDLELTTAWGVEGMIGASLTDEFGLFLSAVYAESENELAGVEDSMWAAALTGKWTPVDGLLVSPEIAYESYEDEAGDEDLDAWAATVRVQREF